MECKEEKEEEEDEDREAEEEEESREEPCKVVRGRGLKVVVPVSGAVVECCWEGGMKRNCASGEECVTTLPCLKRGAVVVVV